MSGVVAEGVGFRRPVRSENASASGDPREARANVGILTQIGRTNVGVLTETMMRLRGEIGAWRHSRVALQADLVRRTDERRTRVSALCAVFARDRAGARRAWFGPTVSERRAAERQQQQQLAEEARAKAQAEGARAKAQGERQPPATAKAKLQRREPAKPVPAPAARLPVAPFPQAHKPLFKGSKKH